MVAFTKENFKSLLDNVLKPVCHFRKYGCKCAHFYALAENLVKISNFFASITKHIYRMYASVKLKLELFQRDEKTCVQIHAEFLNSVLD